VSCDYSFMTVQLTMMEQRIIRLLTEGYSPAAYTTEGPHFVAEGSQQQEAQHKSSTIGLCDG